MPRMPFIGVRSSWLTLARKSLLARLAASAASLAGEGFFGAGVFGDFVPQFGRAFLDFRLHHGGSARGE